MPFQSGQIVRLIQGETRLYAEVIDCITRREMLWARPLLLVDPWPQSEFDICLEAEAVQDLREESHLLWPTALFYAVLDTEILPLLPYLYPDKPGGKREGGAAGLAMRQFMAQVWEEQWPSKGLAS